MSEWESRSGWFGGGSTLIETEGGGMGQGVSGEETWKRANISNVNKEKKKKTKKERNCIKNP